MKVLILSAWEDTGGVGIALTRALQRYTDTDVHFVHRQHNYIGYETDIYWPLDSPKPEGLDDLFAAADVIHVMEQWSAATPFEGWYDKPLVMHHHGTRFREWDTEDLIRTVPEYGAVGIVSTIDLTLIDPSCEWLPNPANLAHLEEVRRTHYQKLAFPRISHSPTNRMLKGTYGFLEAARRFSDRLGVDVIEWNTYEECLRRKAQSDIFFDQLHIGYALSGIEAWGMGIPVIGGAQDPRILPLMNESWGYLPFYPTDGERIGDAIEDMLDEKQRRIWAMVGSEHVHRFHDDRKVVARLLKIYERAITLRGTA